MPRKQRFKPSRKPPVATSPQVDDRQEISPDDVDAGTPDSPRQQGVSNEDPAGGRSR
jgi:hypothetical protein